MKIFKFHNDAPILKYFQKSLKSCCLSSLAQDFVSTKQFKAANAISLGIEEYLKSKVGDHIDFANAILKNENKVKRQPEVYYILRKYKKMGYYDILTEISEHVTLVQLMYYFCKCESCYNCCWVPVIWIKLQKSTCN